MGKKVFFRADAGAGIGYGHFIRSLALADMLRTDFECVMFTQSPTPYQVKEAESVCKLITLPADESKFEIFLDYLTGSEIVVLDNYFYSTDYQIAIKNKGCKLVCLDDIHDKHYVADVVVNHGLLSVDDFDVEPYTKLYVGSDYALLRRPFLQFIKEDKRVGSWVITIGGLDEPNVTLFAVNQLRMLNVTDITAIIGDGYQHRKSLEGTGVRILSRLSALQMARVFASSENVICSASTVCYEALSQKCAVYAGWYVDNQKEVYTKLVENRYVIGLGFLLNKFSENLRLTPNRVYLPICSIANSYKQIFNGLI